VRGLLVCALFLSGCASDGGPLIWKRDQPPLIISHRRVPDGWTLPEKYAHCTVVQHNGQKIIENGKPRGRSLIKVECPEAIVYVDTVSKRLVWKHEW
jgi:hypothetical protein